MNWRISLRLISCLVVLEGIAECVSLLAGLWKGDPRSVLWKMFFCSLITIAAGGVGILFSGKKGNTQPGLREGFATVGGAWIICSLFGALPYILISGFCFSDALFESASGLTTTGATVVDKTLVLRDGSHLPNGIESLPGVLLFWRSFTQWVGGAGIMVFFLAILPFFRMGGAQSLYNAEVPGVKNNLDQFTPRIATTAKIIFWTYMIMTFTLVLLLVLGKMPLFDAVCHAFSTVSTGGFSTKNASIGAYPSFYIQFVLILFMFLAGCNFLLLFRLFHGMKLTNYFSEEHKVFTGILLFSSILIASFLFFQGISGPGGSVKQTFPEALQQAVFQVVSIGTTTGFATGDYTLFPPGCAPFILLLIFMGGCGGSTSGGFKCVRLLLLGKLAFHEIQKSIFPRSLYLLKLDGKKMEHAAIQKTIVFFIIFGATFLFFTLLLPIVCKMDLLTAVTSSLSALSNVGPGFGQIGPSSSFAWMNAPAKLLLALEMVIGRLELTTILVFFLPSFWKK